MKQHPRVLVAMQIWQPGLEQVRQLVGAENVVIVPPFENLVSLPVEQIGDCTVVFGEFPPTNMVEMAGLEWVQLGSAGYEQLKGFPLIERGVRVSNASGVNDAPIAEWCIAMMILFERDIRGLLANQRAHVWDRSAVFQSELRGRRAGIIGYGNIGREVGRACRCLGLEVWAMDQQPIGPRPHRYAPPGTGDPDGKAPQRTFVTGELADFLPHLDYLILTMPLTAATRGIIGENELRLMKPTAHLLNPARGPLLVEEALLRALREGWIKGAALDTHFRYPLPAEHPLWDMPNVILTPHISGSSAGREFLPRVWDLFGQNLERFMRSEPLLNELSTAELTSVGVR
jgi:phosphoglycerate dehydrogenase-like enzyme